MDQRISPGRIPELDSIRAIAILLVIGCHYATFSSLLGGLPSYGWIGVDIFFVLSGFLITSILIELRGTKSPIKVFYVRRVLRIFPIYYLMILAVSTASLACREHRVHFGYYVSRFLFLQSFKDSPVLFHQAWSAILSLKPRHALFEKGVLPGAEIGAPLAPWANSLGVCWSLSIEEYFYILWAPIVIFLKDRLKVGLAAVLIFAASVAIQYLGFTGEVDYFDFFCRIDTIMAGSMLALFLRWRSQLQDTSRQATDMVLKVLAAFLSAALVAILLVNRPVVGHELRDSVSFMVLGMPILSVLLTLTLGWIVQRRGRSFFLLRALRWKPACYIGTISYSLYIFHIPIYYLLLRCAAALRLSGYPATLMVGAAAFLLSILCSALSWKYFETPILNRKDRWAPTGARVVAEIAANKCSAGVRGAGTRRYMR
jgi:peptidoglycan/LPS O-acetylase OafA/YrhL